MRIFAAIFVMFAVTVGGCASSQTAGTGSSSSAPSGQPAGNQIASASAEPELICRRIKKTGTRFTEKVCMTPEQVERMKQGSANAARQVGDWQRRNVQAGGPLEGGM